MMSVSLERIWLQCIFVKQNRLSQKKKKKAQQKGGVSRTRKRKLGQKGCPERVKGTNDWMGSVL